MANGALATFLTMKRQFKNLRIGSLPGGDRRGMSGAGAGHDSMRTASGSPLNRRAGVGETENVTADSEGNGVGTNETLPRRKSPVELSAGPFVGTTISPTTAGKQKWSQAELEELMYCYFKARGEGGGYIKKLESIYKERNPTNSKIYMNGSLLSNQARRIIKQNVLSKNTLDTIQKTIENESQQASTSVTPIIHNTRSRTTSTSSSSSINQLAQINSRKESQGSINVDKSQCDRRSKWTESEKEELIYCYYMAKYEGTEYIRKLERLFKQRNPDNPKIHKFNGNTLSNQARRILKQNLISQEQLNRIKQSAEIEMQLIQHKNTTTPTNTQTHTPTILNNIIEEVIEEPTTFNNETREICNTPEGQVPQTVDYSEDPLVCQFLNILAETKEIAVEDREYLPKAKINKQYLENLAIINNFMPNLLPSACSLRDTNDIIYSAAKTLILNNNQSPYTPSNVIKPHTDPPWKKRVKVKIERLRKELGQMIEISRGVNSRKMIKIKDKLHSKYNIQNDIDHKNREEILKQRIKALAGRIKRYEEINSRKQQNKMFTEDEHRLYRSLSNKQENINIKLPSKDSTEEFWKNILSQPVSYNHNAKWISDIVQHNNTTINTNLFEEITTEQIKQAVGKMLNWKAPGQDKIQNYYLKYFSKMHDHLAILFTNILKGEEPLEDWLTTGKVILIPKNLDTEEPKNWRPIACLPSMYKLLTSILADQLYNHCAANNIMAPEQRGCRRGARGCKDHLMVNKAILEDAHKSQKNLSMGWIDYQKAFDSISHEWLLQVLDIYKCPPVIKSFLERAMPKWKVVMTAKGSSNSFTTEPIMVRRGIFQGDSLSPMLFCLALNPISTILRKYDKKGYHLRDSVWINHLVYMDDLKVYANNKTNLKILLNSVEIFTADIGMSFGFDKCNILHITAGHRNYTEGDEHVLLNGYSFKQLKIDQTYKYLGINESGKINHSIIRDQLTKEYFRRVKNITNSYLNARNLLKGINTYAVPVLMYSFGVINYNNSDLKRIDVKTRKLLAIKKVHQQKADLERLYLPITSGGRGLINIENLYKAHILKYKLYLEKKSDYLIEAIVQHDQKREKYSIYKDSLEIETELRLTPGNNHTQSEIKNSIIKKQNVAWRNKSLHGQFPKKVLDLANIDRELTFKWLKNQSISPALESSIFAIQDQAVITRQHERDILKRSVDGKCRLCVSKDETVQHLLAGCEKLAGTYFVKRHNNLVQYIFWCLARKSKIEVNKLWWKEELKQPTVRENSIAKLMWEIPVQTDVTIVHNRPDLIYIDKANNHTYLIDISVPSDYNIGAKELEKISKYHPLKIELSRLWNTTVTTIPIVVGATGVVTKSLQRYCDKLDARINIQILQKQAALFSSTIISKVLGDTVFVTQSSQTQQTSIADT